MTRDEDSPKPSTTWIIDSETSRHMTSDKSLFTSRRDIETLITITNGAKLHARGIGSVEFDLDGQIFS